MLCSSLRCAWHLGSQCLVLLASTSTMHVASGINCKGATVLHGAGIDLSDGGLSEQFLPIGNSSNCFQGIFDGQGYNQWSCSEIFFTTYDVICVFRRGSHQKRCARLFSLYYQFILRWHRRNLCWESHRRLLSH